MHASRPFRVQKLRSDFGILLCTMAAKTFQSLYRKLNPEQKQAVDAIEGPVMVIAGPGTGKTQILTLRIANILEKTDTPPDAILALTFTESAAFAMRKRLVEIVGSPAYRIHIHTFHGFCNDIIQRYPESFPRIIGAKSLTDIDKILLMQEIIRSAELQKLRPFGDPYYYLNAALGAISQLKRENVSVLDFELSILQEREKILTNPELKHLKGAHKGKIKGAYQTELDKLTSSSELALLYQKYEEELAIRRLYDFEDMILEVVRMLDHDEEFRLRIQEEFLYLLADEHQDANNAQNKLLELLSCYHDEPNLFIVGDQKQAIYRFQGASLENFLYFKKRYPSALLISLKTNYRSEQGILDAAHTLIKNSSSAELTEVELVAARRGNGLPPVRLLQFSQPDRELMFVAAEIRSLIDEGVTPHEIAVLYRKNKDAEAVATALERLGVPFIIESQENVLDDPEIRKVTIFMRAVSRFGDEPLLFALLHMDFLKVEPLNVYKLARYRVREKLQLSDILSSVPHLRRAGVTKPAELRKLFSLLTSFATLARNRPALEALEHMLDESGFVSHVLSLPSAVETLAKLNGLVDTFKEAITAHHAYTLADLVEYVALLERHQVSVRKDSEILSPERVRLMTAHRSKGLEFDRVYVLGLQDGHWQSRGSRTHFYLPFNKPRDEAESEGDDRRLFYVALTRARGLVTLTFAGTKQDGSPALPSQYVEEIAVHVHSEDTAAFETSISPTAEIMPRHPAEHSVKDKLFLNELFAEQGLSVTALNNYLRCPWNYFYGNLLRIPKAPDKYALFGNAIHRALRELYESVDRGQTLTKPEFVERFRLAAEREPFSEFDLEEATQKGAKILDSYYERYKETWGTQTLSEFKINAVYQLPGLPSIPVRGILDRVEFGEGSKVVVFDYKTGKPKTRGDIEGTTKSSLGEYKRQLNFYYLLLSLYERGKWRMQEGVIDFVEPDQKGRFHQERFIIDESEVAELRKTVETVAEEIYNLSFWDKRCDEKDCDYCKLRDFLPSKRKASPKMKRLLKKTK